MSTMSVRAAIRAYQPKTVASCVFGSRVKRYVSPFNGNQKCFEYWTSDVTVVQPIVDRKNDVLCFLVDDTENKAIGVAVVSSHMLKDKLPPLMVSSDDIWFYTSEDIRQEHLSNLRKFLLSTAH